MTKQKNTEKNHDIKYKRNLYETQNWAKTNIKAC